MNLALVGQPRSIELTDDKTIEFGRVPIFLLSAKGTRVQMASKWTLVCVIGFELS